MKRTFTLLALFLGLGLGLQTAFAQGFTGRAYYKSSSSFSIKMDSTKMAPEQMAQIQASLKKQMEQNYVLSFNQTESTRRKKKVWAVVRPLLLQAEPCLWSLPAVKVLCYIRISRINLTFKNEK